MSDDCIFCKIAGKQIPVQPVYEDDEFIAFHDLNKQAPVHVLVIPKKHYETVMDVEEVGVLGRAILAANETARRMNLQDDGFRLVINYRDDGGQTVYHLHIHLMGGRFMQWPPG
jgi:histidine triad (HIT) family protein